MGPDAAAQVSSSELNLNSSNGGSRVAGHLLIQLEHTLSAVENAYQQRISLGLSADKDGKTFPKKGSRIRNIIVLNDCNDTNAFGRILPVLRSNFGAATIDRFDVKPYAKIEIGFILADYLAEIASRPQPGIQPATIILGNSAPRAEKNSSAKGCPFVFAELPFGQFYFGTLGEELSYVKPYIIGKIWQLDMTDRTVFRSRYLSDVAKGWIKRERSIFTKEIEVGEIPDINPFAIGTIDSFGNLKTGLTGDHPLIQTLSCGDALLININGVRLGAKFANSLADGDTGDIVLAKGSSCQNLTKLDERSYDIYCLNGSAENQFNAGNSKIRPGDIITISKA
jgi:hypothetical protein